MTKAVSQNLYKKLQKAVQEDQAAVARARREALAIIKQQTRRIWARDNAIVAYLDARSQARASIERLASVHPEKAANWSLNARRRAGYA
jgi:flagellar biosynthesis/type III secretory pathway chaperone